MNAPARQGRADIGTIDDLHAAATKITGLDDFGGDEYREGLRVLLAAYQDDERLTPWGNRVTRAALRDALAARALSELAWKQHPEHAAVTITRPVFVTGLPRTGTTALHRLLCADPRHQGLEMWLTQVPQPRPPREAWADDPIFSRMQAGFEQHHIENPEFMGVHYMSADMVEECWQLLRQSMLSIAYECLAHVPSYAQWLQHQDWVPAYERHKRNLQLIGLNDQDKRWILKNPSHLFAVDALLEVYPDALIVQCHRDPRTIIASTSSLSAHATEGQSEIFVGDVIGADQLDTWARGAQLCLAARERHDPAHFVDVDYRQFAADPLSVIETIYAQLGSPLTDEARAAITDADAQSRAGDQRPSHKYSLADFGLTEAQVTERFADYIEHYFPG